MVDLFLIDIYVLCYKAVLAVYTQNIFIAVDTQLIIMETLKIF